MPYRGVFFEKNQPFHIISRAVEERKIFEEEDDCYRFIFQIYAANIGRPVFNLRRRDIIKASQSLLAGEEISEKFIIKEHSPLVYILDFSLVMNHYHFYLIPNFKNGVPIYMQKLNGGFAKYFNLKHGRKGSLFGSRYKSILVKTEFQSDAVSRYVSIINPLDVFQPGWREEELKNWQESYRFLKDYQFSSFPEKIGERNSKFVAGKEIRERYGVKPINNEEYFQFLKDFLQQHLASSQKLFLE